MISKIMKKMVDFSEGSIHDIDHFIKVWTYAKTIGELEHLDNENQFILEVSAIVHDIACPSIRKVHGKALPKLQEEQGPAMARDLLLEFNLTDWQLSRVMYLVGHHHTFTNIDGIDYQILVEADYIVNATESGYSLENIKNTRDTIFKTNSGKELLDSVFKSII